MATQYPPNMIIYSRRGQIYNYLASTCLIVAVLLMISTFFLDIIGMKHLANIIILSALFTGISSLIFNIKASKHSTVI
jgi:hypothetical protein